MEPKCPKSWREERRPDGVVVFKPVGESRVLALGVALVAVPVAILTQLLSAGSGAAVLPWFIAGAALFSYINTFRQCSFHVSRGLVEVWREVFGRSYLEYRWSSAEIEIFIAKSTDETLCTVEIAGKTRYCIYMCPDSQDAIDTAAYLSELTGWKLVDRSSGDPLRSSLECAIAGRDLQEIRAALGDARSSPSLLEVWRKGSLIPRDELIALLRRVEPEQQGGRRDSLVAQRMAEVLDSSVPRDRATAIEIIEHLEGPRAAQLLLQYLQDGSVYVKRQVADSLCRLRSPLSVPDLCLVALEGPDPEIRQIIVTGLSEFADRRALDLFLHVADTATHPGERTVRLAAVVGLGKLRDASAVPCLTRTLQDLSESVRVAAAEALGRIGCDSAVPQLALAAADQKPEVRRKVAEALGRIGTFAAIEALCGLTRDPVRDVRAAAVESLGATTSAAAITALTTALGDPEPNVRREAARGLGRIALAKGGGLELRGALPTLHRLGGALSREHSDVKRACRVAIERIEESTDELKSIPLPASAGPIGPEAYPVPHPGAQDDAA